MRTWNNRGSISLGNLIGIAAGVVGGTILAVAAAPVVLPAMGAAGLLGAAGTGTAIATLGGASLTSASCAAITGTIAGTTAVCGAAGAVAGGVSGKVISDKISKK